MELGAGDLIVPGIRIETIQVHDVAHALNPRGPFLRGYGLAPGFRGILGVFPVRERADFPTTGIGKRVSGRLSDNVEFHGAGLELGAGDLVDENVGVAIRQSSGDVWLRPGAVNAILVAEFGEQCVNGLAMAIGTG